MGSLVSTPFVLLITDRDNATHGLRQRFTRMEYYDTLLSAYIAETAAAAAGYDDRNTTVMQRGRSRKGLSNVAY
jgi:hypothetical protein